MRKKNTRFNAFGICPGDGKTGLKGALYCVRNIFAAKGCDCYVLRFLDILDVILCSIKWKQFRCYY
jgi:hypothetical protein